ncbi:MAG TPA: imidazole glycerol phosphate synthase subunit HisF [Myxococcales bacterium LLY-WYZ-16_1]|jgi:imidazole glycerol-phosphate synthase subunit HisF|nr:imidazole glycerol phosphate synthase subunit HisF [Myxococcales bacterium LLY-WYZ-16_1]
MAAGGIVMLKVRIIPCLDTRDGRVVKGIRFQNLVDAGDPVEASSRYEVEGADELVVLDVSATPEGRAHRHETVEAIRKALSLPLTCGGGVRRVEDVRLLLEAGADKVAVNTAAVEHPELLSELAQRFGTQCIVVAVDAARRVEPGPDGVSSWEVVTRSGRHRTGVDAVAWCAEAERRGAGEVLLTSWDRDGTRQGYDTELLAAVRGRVRCPVVASGGASQVDHFVAGVESGADALLAASIFHYGEVRVADLKRALGDRGVPVRPAGEPAAGTGGVQ